MLVYLQRWQVANSLYHLQKKRNNNEDRVQEHDLCAYIGGKDIQKGKAINTPLEIFRAHLAYIFWRAKDHAGLYRAIEKTIKDCQDKNVSWIIKTNDPDGISYCLDLTARGREVYPFSHLISKFFENYYVRWGVGILFTWLIGQHIIARLR